MAKLKVEGLQDYSRALQALGARSSGVMKRAAYEGARETRKAVERAIRGLPVDEPRLLKIQDGERYRSVTPRERDGLLDHLGVSPIVEEDGTVSVRVGFDGYIETIQTKKYPRGLPAAMIARSIESGSSVRQKTPFIRKAVNGAKSQVEAAMARAADELIDKIMND